MRDRLNDLLHRPIDPQTDKRLFFALIGLALLVFVVLANTIGCGRDDEPKRGRVLTPPPVVIQKDHPETAQKLHPATPTISRDDVIRAYARDYLRWERGETSASEIRYLSATSRGELASARRTTPASAPDPVARRNGKLWIDWYYEGDAVQIRARLQDRVEGTGRKARRVPNYESWGVSTERLGDEWVVIQ